MYTHGLWSYSNNVAHGEHYKIQRELRKFFLARSFPISEYVNSLLISVLRTFRLRTFSQRNFLLATAYGRNCEDPSVIVCSITQEVATKCESRQLKIASLL